MIRKEEAVSIFDKWCAEKSEILVSGRFFGWSLNARCRVSLAVETEIRLVTSDGGAMFALDPSHKDMAFEYGEPPASVATNEVSALVMALPFRVTLDKLSEPIVGPTRELLTFLELRPNEE